MSRLEPITLEGRYVRLEPLTTGHVPHLLAAAREPRDTFALTTVPSSEAETIDYVKRGLELKGYAVDTVGDGDTGLSYAVDPDYDLIILDRMLPGSIDGLAPYARVALQKAFELSQELLGTLAPAT